MNRHLFNIRYELGSRPQNYYSYYLGNVWANIPEDHYTLNIGRLIDINRFSCSILLSYSLRLN